MEPPVARPRPAAPTFAWGSGLFIRVLAVVHAVAFASFLHQAGALVGPHGILPAGQFFTAAREQLGPGAYWQVPSLCWVFGTGAFLTIGAAAGLALAVLLFLGVAPALCLLGLWLLYLSLACAGQIFYDYQWDALLLETTLVALFLVPWRWRARWGQDDPPRLARWLVWWLLFRLMLLSGLVKLTSGDPTWRHLTALRFHFETQPLPTPLAYYVHHWPLLAQKLACGALLAIELLAPLTVFATRRWRHAGALVLIGLQFLIALTGNYTFFNLLTAALGLAWLDDGWWRRTGITPAAAGSDPRALQPRLLRGFAFFALTCTFLEALADFSPVVANSPAIGLLAGTVAPFRSLNNYGLFAVMTTERPQLVIEGSDDGKAWLEYVLPHQAGDLTRRPDFVAPGQPRLDWQLWFAALEPPGQNRWVEALGSELLRGNPTVLRLFAFNPFPAKPPHYLRVVRYDYHFTDAAEKARTGRWWRRTPTDLYINPIALR